MESREVRSSLTTELLLSHHLASILTVTQSYLLPTRPATLYGRPQHLATGLLEATWLFEPTSLGLVSRQAI
jgi:hypothetical protein